MTLLTRAAALAVLTFTLSGLLATSTPGVAAEIDRATVAAPIVQTSVEENTSTLLPVPMLPDVTVYPTLAAAVAAQDAAAADETLRCLAGAIFFEAQGEPLSGQLAVAEVILNRAKSGRFPADICSVITQRGQFGFVRRGVIPAIDATRVGWKRAVAVAKVAMAEAWNSPAANALYFNASRRSPAARAIRVAAIGNHVFYR